LLLFILRMKIAVLLLGIIGCSLAYNVSDIIRGYGYPCEEHVALTPDGWYLSMQRIPYGKQSKGPAKGSVLFQHGLTDNSAGSCLNDPEESLPFILADAGYDVWLGNNRGNGYSMHNIHYTPEDAEFWDFSWDDMALSDLPTQVGHVISVTGRSQISYIGHSEGTTQAFSGFLNQTLANQVNVFIALAPAVFEANCESLIVQALAKLDTVEIFDLLGIAEFALPNVIQKLLPGICDLFPDLCDFDIELIMGPTTYLNETRIGYYADFEPNPTSVKNMAHWAQQVNAETFTMFNYGSQGNMQHYNQSTPPIYDLSKFPTSLPVAIFMGGEDFLADPTDVERLIGILPFPPFVHNEPDYAHLDPLLGYNAYQRIYPLVLEFLEKYNV